MASARVSSAASWAAALLLVAAPAFAQYPAQDPATGEDYHVEIGVGLWKPTPEILISAETLGVPGSNIDFVSDLGIPKSRFGDFRVVFRPARKHKFRLSYVPIKYEADTTLSRTIVFRGSTYAVGLPVQSTLEWKAWRFGYEWDAFYRDRGFVGLIVEAKYTDVAAELRSPLRFEAAHARAPLPAIGGIARGYVAPNIAITGELTAFKLPGSIAERENASGSYFDLDIYGTLNFVDQFGVQIGWRSIDVGYVVDDDFGDLRMKGLYVMSVARF